MPGTPLLELKGIGKHFGAIHALSGVDPTIERSGAVRLMGDNGAGKSTLMKIIAGNYPPASGNIVLEGRRVHFGKNVADPTYTGLDVCVKDNIGTCLVQ